MRHRPLLGQRPSRSPLGSRWLAVGAAASFTLLCAAVSAQQAPAAAATQGAATEPALEEVVVTGSRIPVPANITATSPITTLSRQEIQLGGHTDTTELINQLPQNVISSGADLGNNQNPLDAAGGVSTADLRGLGPQRTLVLVDGKRLYIGDPNSENANPAADLDQIPAIMIERVDVVTGGGSAVYGSDAVAGVINFIMKKNFQGIELTGQYGFYEHQNGGNKSIYDDDAALQAEVGPTTPSFLPPQGSVQDGYKRDFGMLIGTNVMDGEGNITGYVTWHHQDPITQGARDFSNCLTTSNGDGTFSCNPTSNSNYFQPRNGPNKGTTYEVLGTSLVPWGTPGASPPYLFNPNPYQFLQREDDRWNAGMNAHVEITPYFKPYLTATFMDDRTTSIVGPSAAFKNSYPFSADNYYRINCTNPLLSVQEQATLCSPAMIAADTASPGVNPAGQAVLNIGRRNVEGGGRTAFYDHTNYRIAFGSTGDIAPGVSYDAYGQYFYTSLFNSNTNYLNYANIGQALLATGTAANPVCTNTVGNCVPWNILATGGVTPQQLAYLDTPGTGYGTDSETIAHADITALLGQYGATSPFAHDGVAVNAGFEHRGDTYDFSPDAVEAADELSGFSGAVVAIHAAESVNEGFIEVRAPLVQDHPFVKDLDLDIGYRYSNYSVSGVTETYKFEVQYAPLPDFRLRYSYDRAVRVPNLFELYSPQSYGQTTIVGVDPCAGAAPGLSETTCERTGSAVVAATYGTIPQCTANQCGQVIGGNPKLMPEEADTYSIGATITPTALPNFSGSIDYWHIAQFGLVGVIPANIILAQCLATGAAAYCSQIVRNPVTGALTGATVAGGGYLLQTDINTGTGLTSGIDVQATYRQGLGSFGALTAILNGTYLEHSISTPFPGSGSYDCAGLFGASCNTNSVNPHWRSTLRANWETPWDHLLLSVNWRFIGATDFDNNSNNPLLMFTEEGAYDYSQPRIANYSYFDFAADWAFWKHTSLRAGINNAFDKAPPLIGAEVTGTGSPNTYPTYDLLGREVFVNLTAQF